MRDDSRGLPVHTPGFRWGRALLAVAGLVVLYIVGRIAVDTVAEGLGFHLSVTSEPLVHRMIMTAMAAYVVLMAIPFMPGVEIGFSMILVLGPKIGPLVYLGALLALILAYAAGRLVPVAYCSGVFGYLGLTRAQRLMDDLAPLTSEERLQFFLDRAPAGIVPFLLRHRFVALAVLINLPGNIVIGGGGGIAMLAGITGLYPFPAYFLTIALAVAPVPLVIYLTEIAL